MKRILAMLLSAVLVFSVFGATPAYAQELSGKAQTERFVKKSLSVMESKIERVSSKPMVSVSAYDELINAIESKESNIYLLQNIYLESVLEIDYDISFLAPASGKTIYSAPGMQHIKITAPDVQIRFSNIVLDGQKAKTTDKTGGVDACVENVSITGLVIQNCRGTVLQSFTNNSESSFYLYDSIIRDNDSDDSMVFLGSDNVLIYNSIFENNVIYDGFFGTLVITPCCENSYGNVTIYDSIIRNNTARYYTGLGIASSDVFLNEGTIIENNYASRYSAGICADNSNVESYAAINNNVSLYSGAGVYLINSTFTMQGGKISNNIVEDSESGDCRGAGIAIQSEKTDGTPDVIINDGVIERNFAYAGAAISCLGTATEISGSIQINGGEIRENGYTLNNNGELDKVAYVAGAILVAAVKMTDGIIEKNLATLFGGGIGTSKFEMSGGTIQDNGFYETESGEKILKTEAGGGVFVDGSTSITGGLIFSNMAEIGGGMYVDGYFNITSPAYIRYNSATEQSGGVYFGFEKNIESNADLKRIKDNTAPVNPQYN